MSFDPNSDFGANELDWQAFCYVSDELPKLERQKFEDRLGVDQDARDAVVRVMELAELTYHCFDALPAATDSVLAPVNLRSKPQPATAMRRPVPSMLFAAAVCVMLFTLGWGWLLSSSDDSDSIANVTRDVADAWSGLADWGNSELLVAQSERPPSMDESSWLEQQFALEETNIGQRDDVLADSNPSDLQAESGSWMLVALMDLENAEEEGPQ